MDLEGGKKCASKTPPLKRYFWKGKRPRYKIAAKNDF